MAFGSNSAVFSEFLKAILAKSATGYGGVTTDTLKVALYGNSGTPDRNAAVGSTGYNTGQWVTANQSGATDTNWPAAGLALPSSPVAPSLANSAGTVTFDAADLSHTGTVTFTDVRGCLLYDTAITAGTVANQGVSFHSFGGGGAVTAGVFTIVWNSSGLFTLTV